MKKSVITITISFLFLMIFSVFASAAEINMYAPGETEIMPRRDFYVVGRIDREGKSAKDEPLDIRIELINEKGDIIRSLESNVAPNGLTPANYFQTDYELGYPYNDLKDGFYLNSFTPPEIMFDGFDRDSIRLPHTKIVVKEDYFAAIIFGGATKDIELKYQDKHETTLSDITEGKYELVVTAFNDDGEEVANVQQELFFGSDKERLIAKNISSTYVNENSLVVPNSIVGYWKPQKYIKDAPNNFGYVTPERLIANLALEFGESKEVNILLNDLDTDDVNINMMLGSIFNEDSKANVSYLYYDIGEETVNFKLAGSILKKDSEIIENKKKLFLKTVRAETRGEIEGQSYVDFSMDDGVIIPEKIGTTFYGVYSPIITSATLTNGRYKINDGVSKIKAVILNENDDVVYEEINTAALIKENSEITSRFEFKFSITPNEQMTNAKNLTLTFYALDTNGEELLSSDDIDVRVGESGKFITGYDEKYWGSIFCDTVNDFGRSPSGEALAPDESITRGDFAAMVNHLMGYYLNGKSLFNDIDHSNIYYKDCVTAQRVGYMTGDENGNINAEDLITREQAMIILSRISGAEKGEKLVTFKDSDKISFWAKDYVDAMCAVGIVSGFDGYINPTDNITVAEAAALIIKTMKWMYSDEETLPVGIGNNFTVPDTENDWSEIEIIEMEIVEKLEDETVKEYFYDNSAAFIIISDYIQKNYPNGISLKKVGKGLEIRDYKTGNIVIFSKDAVNLITKLSSNLVSFSIKYNPVASDAVHFKLGVNKTEKEVGVVYSSLSVLKGKTLEELAENWYFYRQE